MHVYMSLSMCNKSGSRGYWSANKYISICPYLYASYLVPVGIDRPIDAYIYMSLSISCNTHMSLCLCLLAITGWRRLIGSPKLQIIFHKRATKYRALLRKMSYKDKGSYESSPPCSIYRPMNTFDTSWTTGNISGSRWCWPENLNLCVLMYM